MSDHDLPFYSPYRKPPAPRQPQPGELVWEAHIRGGFYRCELRDHGEWGVEAQILLDNDLYFAQRFPFREEALEFARRERRDLERQPMTTETSRCPLCQRPATLDWIDGRDAYRIRCDVCIGYTATAAFIKQCERARTSGRTDVLDELSAHTAATQRDGGNVNFDVDAFAAG